MTVALAHRPGLHADTTIDSDRDTRVRASADGRVVVGWDANVVTLGTLIYGWAVKCAVCGVECAQAPARYLSLRLFAEHHNDPEAHDA